MKLQMLLFLCRCDSLDSLSLCSAGASIASLSGILFVFLQVSVYVDRISIFFSSNREILVEISW